MSIFIYPKNCRLGTLNQHISVRLYPCQEIAGQFTQRLRKLKKQHKAAGDFQAYRSINQADIQVRTLYSLPFQYKQPGLAVNEIIQCSACRPQIASETHFRSQPLTG
ncbi:hypothetical protein D3C75_1005500 [compost metagenome]